MPTAFTVEGAPTTIYGEYTPSVFVGSTPMRRQLLDTVEVEDTAQVVSLRSPQYGIPLQQRLTWLRALVPNGSPSYVGLFTAMPTRAGTGGSEAAISRVAHSTWRDVVVGGFVARRANSGEVRFDALAADLSVIGWGIWNASSAGGLLAFGLLRNSDGQSRIFNLASGDSPVFTDSSLQWGLQ